MTQSSSQTQTVIDEAFTTLQTAENLEEEMNSSQEESRPAVAVAAATKYFEACALLDRATLLLSEVVQDEDEEKSQKNVVCLLNDKSTHYKSHATTILRGARFSLERKISSTRSNVLDSSCHIDVSRVDKILSNAMDLDEEGQIDSAIEAYVIAADGYLDVLRENNESYLDPIRKMIRRRLHCILDRVEELRAK